MRKLTSLLVAGLVVCAGALSVSTAVPAGTGFLPAYRTVHTRLEAMVSSGDGEAYAQLARDPLLRRPAAFTTGATKQAGYRAQRPIWGYLIFAASFGQRGWTFASMFVLEWLSIAWLLWLVVERVGPVGYVTGVLMLPSVKSLTPEPLGMAFALAGWFPLIGLVRETYLVFPVAAFMKTRERKFLVPIAVYGLWRLVILTRGFVGSPPRALGLPLEGLVHWIPDWNLQSWYSFALLIILGAAAARRYWRETLLFGAIAMVTDLAWRSWLDFGRVFLPIMILGVIGLDKLPLVFSDRK